MGMCGGGMCGGAAQNLDIGHPDVSPEERASLDVIKRILKLRWIGREAEAERMLLSALRRAEPRDSLSPGP